MICQQSLPGESICFRLQRRRRSPIWSYQAILGKNFSQSEYVAVGAIFQFALLTLTRSDSSCVPLCKSFEHVWQTSVPFHKSFERQFLYSHSISSNPHVLLAEPITSTVSKLFRSLKIALTHTPLRASIEIAW